MSTVHERTVAENAAWWAAHPNFRKPFSGTAESLAFATVHWIHNAESSQRYGTRTGDNSGPMAPNDRYFGRLYAIFATQAWLAEAQRDLELYPADHAHWHGYGHRDQEVLIRNLQVALDDFEWNDKNSAAIS